MREVGFLVADKNMEACLQGLFGRKDWHLSIGCDRVDISRGDVHVAAGLNDPGLYARGSELLRSFFGRFAHMVVMIDAQWDGSPGAKVIETRIEGHLMKAGWSKQDSLALVLDPEVDVWLWTTTDHTAKALGWPSWADLGPRLVKENWWAPPQAKPPQPKEAAEWALRERRKPRSSSVYQLLAGSVGLGRCGDPSFIALRAALQRWFP